MYLSRANDQRRPSIVLVRVLPLENIDLAVLLVVVTAGAAVVRSLGASFSLEPGLGPLDWFTRDWK